MADEAFALSPISARAAMPSDADYDAIREAFMETSRGRWFLTEYAKRNRNADTRMVLDAVARIEQNLSAQKQQAGGISLNDSLVAIRAIVGEARANVARSLVGLDNVSVLKAAQVGARIIREVSWTLRECGADIRICNLLDSQVAAIEASQRVVAEIDTDAVLGALDGMLDHIHDLAGEARTPQPAPRNDEPDSPAADGDLPEAAAIAEHPLEAPVAATAAPAAEAALSPRPEAAADSGLTIVTGTTADDIEFVESRQADAPAATSPDVVAPPPEATDVDTVLDLVALEMSAPQPEEPSELAAAIEAARIEEERAAAQQPSEIEQLVAEVATLHEAPDVAELASVDSEEPAHELSADAAEPETPSFEIGERGEPLYVPETLAAPVTASAFPSAIALVTPAPAVAAAAPAAAPPVSLGAALLANGVIGHPAQSRNDALAPLRRMSQPEKIAFFS